MVTLIDGSQAKWGIKPKMRAMQSQPTVSRSLLHHIQRDQIKVRPNVERLDKDTVYFDDGESTKADMLIACTGYRIDLPYLHADLKAGIKEGENDVFLYKNVFSPTVGPSLAFIGFVQPASGGVLPMSEIQARWLCAIVNRKVTLPPVQHMVADIHREQHATRQRYFKSARHTIQRDPILYCGQIAQMLGTQPRLWRHPTLALRLLLGSGGTFQWRLDGPGKWDGAAEAIRDVPLPGLTTYGLAVILLLLVSLPITLPVAVIMALLLYVVQAIQGNYTGASGQVEDLSGGDKVKVAKKKM
ncbi:hypothetical protein SARC_07170 [Sphaeroforma arctica JP610]|uniref:Flavin-containing monooxygenase n=1 Tax=Sphaeroforma arctica JP610 TaxID=667725 RepID=A0A0L0FUG1_9EUKA|nr:hypothetical protein SARC_07170 [Sphaeroforma arctica JP610]KNC80467.1 hypothetical protein SARC_07170 [Sphaeroforma arctica JP610]|eukprot:XP_014154369.1 hypothetical protein SARC_07170 [Sphaeroforma arctica JP610]